MATKAKQLTSWSFSRYSDYKQCPLKAKLKHIDKIKEPGSEALERGAAIHELAEKYIKGLIPRLPPELKLFKDEFAELKKRFKSKLQAMVVEDNWAFDKQWNESRWDDWVNCWVRIKLDCAHRIEDGRVLVVTDWKTGKFRPELHEEYLEQLELYALGALLLFQDLDAVKPRLGYLDFGQWYPKDSDLVYTRADLPKLKKLWEKRTKPMLSDKTFAPRPNDKCRWCHYRGANKQAGGGQCKY